MISGNNIVHKNCFFITFMIIVSDCNVQCAIGTRNHEVAEVRCCLLGTLRGGECILMIC